MKIFKFKFNKLTLAAIYAGLVLAVAAFGLNTFFLIRDGVATAAIIVYPILQYTLTYFCSVMLFIVLITLLFSSYYSVDGKTLKTSFGIIKSKYDIGKIETVALDRATNKLSVYFDNNSFMVIVVKQEWYEDFVDAILKANPKIEYTIRSKENTDPDQEEKK